MSAEQTELVRFLTYFGEELDDALRSEVLGLQKHGAVDPRVAAASALVAGLSAIEKATKRLIDFNEAEEQRQREASDAYIEACIEAEYGFDDSNNSNKKEG